MDLNLAGYKGTLSGYVLAVCRLAGPYRPQHNGRRQGAHNAISLLPGFALASVTPVMIALQREASPGHVIRCWFVQRKQICCLIALLSLCLKRKLKTKCQKNWSTSAILCKPAYHYDSATIGNRLVFALKVAIIDGFSSLSITFVV
jgi:hypothetical protein